MSYFKGVKIQGTRDDGSLVDVPLTQEGHLEVAVHGPNLPFGSIHTESIVPVFQTDGVYGYNPQQMYITSSLSGSYTEVDSAIKLSTGTTQYALAVFQSRKRLRYRAGQGVILRFTTRFSTPVSYNYQICGLGHSEDGLYFGYKEIAGLTPEFGILYVNRAYREIRTLTLSTASNTNENVTVTLNGTAYTVAVTNSNVISRTAYEISQGTFNGWRAYPKGSTIIFINDNAGAKSGSYSLTGTTASGTFAQTRAGETGTETFIPQSDWNGDKLDGTGSSGIVLDPTKGNVYQIEIQYLGYGTLTFKVEVATENSNNASWVVVHTIKNPNTLTKTTFGNPSFPFTMAVYSAGSTSNVSIETPSLAGFIEGGKKLHGNRLSYYAQSTAVGAGAYVPLITVGNAFTFKSKSNQTVINLLSISGAIKHTSPVIYYLVKNGTLTGPTNFIEYSTTSVSILDTASTGITWTDNSQLVWSGHLGDTGEFDHSFADGEEELTIQPGEYFTLCCKTTTQTASWVTGSINTREDQ